MPRLPTLQDLRSLGPVAAVPMRESLRASAGAMLGLTAMMIVALAFSPENWNGLYLIAPFGACAVLAFAVPNSPLAQPWPTVVGNTVSALVAIAVCRLVPNPMFSVPLSIGAAIIAMALCRATYPPGGAVAMTVALGAEAILPSGFGFAFLPVAAGSLILVFVAAVYAPLTGRHYPLRQFHDPNPNGTHDPEPVERFGLSEAELGEILSRYRQSLNLGVEDLARLIAAAELKAASHRVAPQTAADIMSRDLVTVSASSSLSEVTSLFVAHRFTSLPVVGEGGRYLGVIFQLHLIAGAIDGPRTGIEKFMPWPPRDRSRPKTAAAIMETPPVAKADTPIAALLPLLASSGSDAVPVLDDHRIVGIVTQTDLIAALTRQTLQQP